jgi:hypothetical protein
MELSATHTYQHPVPAVFDVLTDFDAMKAKYEALGQTDVELVRRDERDDGSVTVVTRRVVPLDLPGFAKKVLSPRQTITQTDDWSAPDAQGARHGTFTVEAKGSPVTIRGTLHLAPKGAGCTNTTQVTIECKVPLVGGKIAELVAGDTRRAIEHEESWVRAHLA